MQQDLVLAVESAIPYGVDRFQPPGEITGDLKVTIVPLNIRVLTTYVAYISI